MVSNKHFSLHSVSLFVGKKEKGLGKVKQTGRELLTQGELVVVIAVASPGAPATKLVAKVGIASVVVAALGDEAGEAAVCFEVSVNVSLALYLHRPGNTSMYRPREARCVEMMLR